MTSIGSDRDFVILKSDLDFPMMAWMRAVWVQVLYARYIQRRFIWGEAISREKVH